MAQRNTTPVETHDKASEPYDLNVKRISARTSSSVLLCRGSDACVLDAYPLPLHQARIAPNCCLETTAMNTISRPPISSGYDGTGKPCKAHVEKCCRDADDDVCVRVPRPGVSVAARCEMPGH